MPRRPDVPVQPPPRRGRGQHGWTDVASPSIAGITNGTIQGIECDDYGWPAYRPASTTSQAKECVLVSQVGSIPRCIFSIVRDLDQAVARWPAVIEDRPSRHHRQLPLQGDMGFPHLNGSLGPTVGHLRGPGDDGRASM